MSLVLDILSWGALWLIVSVPLGVVVGAWLGRGGGSWLLDSWAEDEERAA